MIQYLIDHPDKILIPLLETVELTLATLVISVALAAVLTILSVKFPRLGYALIQLFSMIYSIPSLAVFALLIPLTGLGKKTAIIVLVIYNQYLLLRNFVTGINEVDPAVVEAARGIGLTDMQILFKVQVPLAKVALYAGIRLAVVSTIGISTIASAINAGGLGYLLFEGLRTMNLVKVFWGSLLSAGLAILVNGLLRSVENYSSRKMKEVTAHVE